MTRNTLQCYFATNIYFCNATLNIHKILNTNLQLKFLKHFLKLKIKNQNTFFIIFNFDCQFSFYGIGNIQKIKILKY